MQFMDNFDKNKYVVQITAKSVAYLTLNNKLILFSLKAQTFKNDETAVVISLL